MSAAINDVAGPLAAEPAPVEPWVEETLDRYMNPIAFSRKNASLPSPQVVGEKVLTSTDGQSVKLTTAILKERPFWSKVSLIWTFKLADLEGNADGSVVVVCLVFDTWNGSVQIIENKVMKVDEVQQPIVGGSWKTKTGFGQLEIKVTPYWTGYEYELWLEGNEVYKHFG